MDPNHPQHPSYQPYHIPVTPITNPPVPYPQHVPTSVPNNKPSHQEHDHLTQNEAPQPQIEPDAEPNAKLDSNQHETDNSQLDPANIRESDLKVTETDHEEVEVKEEEGDGPPFDPITLIPYLQEVLNSLELSCTVMDNWLVFNKKSFDLYVDSEPHIGVSFLLNVETGQWLLRTLGKTKEKGRCTSTEGISQALLECFEGTTVCRGLPAGSSRRPVTSEDGFLALEYPYSRRLSPKCLLLFRGSSAVEGICQKCHLYCQMTGNSLLLAEVRESVAKNSREAVKSLEGDDVKYSVKKSGDPSSDDEGLEEDENEGFGGDWDDSDFDPSEAREAKQGKTAELILVGAEQASKL